jgi:hypothetical protein
MQTALAAGGAASGVGWGFGAAYKRGLKARQYLGAFRPPCLTSRSARRISALPRSTRTPRANPQTDIYISHFATVLRHVECATFEIFSTVCATYMRHCSAKLYRWRS